MALRTEREEPLKLDITTTFLELGDATSRNLAFSHRGDVWVSYGEETITETNLLEIRRRHPKHVRVRTFPRRVEARNGADWEWHIIGRLRTLKMRVQAKRAQCNDVLRIAYEVKSSGKQQRELLIDAAAAAGMKAVYCIYCTESQRGFWKECNPLPGYKSFQTGCLLADAAHVLTTTRKLDEIEEQCRPWHYLFAPAVLMQRESKQVVFADEDFVQFVSVRHPRVPLVEVGNTKGQSEASGWNVPTVDDLNRDTGREFDWTGVEETTENDIARLEQDTEVGWSVARFDRERLQNLGISRMMVIDVRDFPYPEERHGWWDRRRRF